MKTIVLIGDKDASKLFTDQLTSFRSETPNRYEINGQQLDIQYHSNISTVLNSRQSAVIAFESKNSPHRIVNQTSRLPSDTLYFYTNEKVPPSEFIQGLLRKIKPIEQPSFAKSVYSLFGMKPKTQQPKALGGLKFRQSYGETENS